ncbi:MAG: hypothetical protein EOP24_32395 [Hyphomicrobiales bacterium]|nr:MAG: hypothetical protein EOP24_32395 [Hyphomicrobiales bacterium]
MCNTRQLSKSSKLANVLYGIRGPTVDAARQMEEEGHKIIKLILGNLPVFGFGYDKWFMQTIPPKNVRVGLPLSETTKGACTNPNDKPTEDYKR